MGSNKGHKHFFNEVLNVLWYKSVKIYRNESREADC